jgi:hypothetical protein
MAADAIAQSAYFIENNERLLDYKTGGGGYDAAVCAT